MFSAFRSLLRWSFAFTAMFIFPATIAILVRHVRAHDIVSPLRTFGAFVVFLAVGFLYAMACWSTRKPRATRSPWAIAASVVDIAAALVFVWYVHHLRFTGAESVLMIAGIVGLIVFTRRETEAAPVVAAAPAKRAPVPGDRTSPLFDRLSTMIIMVAAWVFILVWYPWAHAHYLRLVSGVPLLLLLALVTLLNAVLHECGHAVVAHIFHMKLLGFNAGPFQWRKREGKWKFQFKAAGILGGSIQVVPTNPAQPAWQDVLMVAAGPLVNICLGPLFFLAALHAPGTRYQPAWFFFALMASFSLLVASFNLLPFRTAHGSYSDGARILQLVTHSPALKLQRAMRRLQSTLVTPLRYRDLDPDYFLQAAANFPAEFTGLHLYLCAAQCFEDLGRIPEARAAIAAAEAIYDNFTIDLPAPLHTVFIFSHAYYDRDAAAARLWWDRMTAWEPEPHTIDYWLARSALLWIEGSLTEAEEAWQKANEEAQRLPDFGAYEFDRVRCALLRHELDSAPIPTSSAAPTSTAQPVRISSGVIADF